MGINAFRIGDPVTVDGHAGIIAGPGSKAGSRYVQTDAGRFLEVKMSPPNRLREQTLLVLADADQLDRRTRLLTVAESGRVVVTRHSGKASGNGHRSFVSRNVYHVAGCPRVLAEPVAFQTTWTQVTEPRPVPRRDAFKLLTSTDWKTYNERTLCDCLTEPVARYSRPAA